MTSWMKALLIGGASAAGVAVVAAAVYFALPYFQKSAPPQRAATISSSSPDFTKAAYQVDSSGNLVLDSNGNPVPVTGPVHVGDQIEYVLTYKAPATGSTGAISITDTLSANQSYVGASLVTPTGWTPSTGTTTPVPYGTGNQQTYTNPTGTNAGDQVGGSVTVAPYTGIAGHQTSGGDGFIPIPVNTMTGKRVYAVNHHLVPGKIMCWEAADLSTCPGFPKSASVGSTQTISTATSPRAAIVGNKFYYAAAWYDPAQTGSGMHFGLGCWDTALDQPCAPVPLPGAPGIASIVNGNALSAYIAGAESDPANPTHIVMFAWDSGNAGRFYCVDVSSGLACAGWPAATTALTGATASTFHDLIVEEGGTRAFLSNSTGSIYCAALSDGSTCAGWPAGGAGTSFSGSLNLGPYLTGTTMSGICLFHSTSGSKPVCLGDSSGTAVTDPTWTAPGWSAYASGFANTQIVAAYHIPGTSRVLYPHNSQAQPDCYDFATQLACAAPQFQPYWNSAGNWTDSTGASHGSTRDYGFAADPDNPTGCIYGLGDGGFLVRFGLDGKPASSACAPHDYHGSADISGSFCARAPKTATWTTANVVRPSGDTELVKGTLTITDSAGNTVTVAIDTTNGTSFPVNMPATGSGASVTITFTPEALPEQPYQVTLNYTADESPQICYRTVVEDCTDGAPLIDISNHAVYTDALGTKDADVNLGKVVGGHCGPPPCMNLTGTVTLNPNGTGTLTIAGSGPPGFNATMLDVHSNTAGVTILPPSRTVPSGPINATFTLAGITAGQSIDIQIDAVDPGAGTNGSDKCCSTTLTVVVPRDDQHGHTDVAIQKTGASEGQGPANGSGYIYTLSVTNVADPINGQNAVVVTDVVPAGLSFASASGTDWNCPGPFPIGAGGTLTCTYVGTGTVATGQVLPPITVVSTNARPGTQLSSVTNCAVVGFTQTSGLIDDAMPNNRSCVTNDAHSQTGSLTVIKTVQPARGYPVPSMSFQANAICTPLGGSPSTTALTLGAANAYTQTVSNLAAGTSCTISETPPSGLPKECHWTTTYPDGLQATIPAGNATLHIVNREECTTSPTDGPTVVVDKVVVIDGKVTYAPRQSFPIRGTCRTPDGAKIDLGFTASAARGLTSPKQVVPAGSRCTVSEPLPPPPPGRGDCHWETTYQFNGRPVHGFPVAIGGRESNTFTVHNDLICKTTDGPGTGNPTDRLCSGVGHWNGKRCVTCNADDVWDDQAKMCTAPRLVCHDPMVPNAAGTACVCPKGMELKDGKCRKSESFLDDVLGHVHIGIGVGGGGSGGHKGGGDSTPPGGK